MADRPVPPKASAPGADAAAKPAEKQRVLPPMPASAASQKATEQAAPDTAAKNNATVSDDTTPIPRFGRRASSSRASTAAASAAPAAPAPGGTPAPAPAREASVRPPVTQRVQAPVVAAAPIATPAAPAKAAATKASPAKAAAGRQPRRARLRLTRIDPWSVMKTAFLLSIALGVVTIVSVMMVWFVLGTAGLWDSINSTVQSLLGGEDAAGFDVQDYVGMSRVLGFTTLVAVVDVILLTALATLAAFLYNMAAALLGGIEVTLAEEHS